MNSISSIALFLFSLTLTAQQDFSKLKWKNRLLVFSTSNINSEAFVKQLDAFLEKPKKMEDRNLLIFVLAKGRVLDNNLKTVSHYNVTALRKKYSLPASFEGLALIGKDGSVKLKKEYYVEPSLVFAAIDKMPMRQQELRENIDD